MSLMRKLTSAIVATSLVFSLVGTAFADLTPASGKMSGERMMALGLLKGKTAADPLSLNDKITRAEFVTVMVRAFGREADAQLLMGAPAYPDTTNHWASGYVALAKNMVKAYDTEMGLPDGKFHPDETVTPAQVVAFMMKFLGVKEDTSKPWPASFLTVAVAKGLITADMAAAIEPIKNDEATRGQAFAILDPSFYSYDLGAGETFYTKYAKIAAPTITLDETAATTVDSMIDVSGKVMNAVSLKVGGMDATINANGTFKATVKLDEMKAYSIPVEAKNLAGVKATAKVEITRAAGEAALIEAPASIEAVAGMTAELVAMVKDAKGNVVKDAVIEGTSDLGTFADGVFTAGTKAGMGTITLKSAGKEVAVNVTVKAGALAKLTVSPATVDLGVNGTQQFTAKGVDQYDNEVALTSAVNWTKSKGVIGVDGTFAATSDATGTVTVTATVGAVSGTATVNVFGQAAKVQIAAPETIVANNKSETTVTATVLDANGNVAKNYNGTVTFASSNTAAVSVKTASVTAVNGIATTTLVGGNSATATVLSASAVGLTGGTVGFTPAKQVATNVAVTASPATLSAATGSNGTLTLKVKDQTGNDMLGTGSTAITVRLTSSDKTIASFGGAEYTDVTFAAGADFAETATITASSKVGGVSVTGAVTAPSGSTITVGSASINTMVVGSAYQLKLDAVTTQKANVALSATVRVLDFNGNQLTTAAGDLAGITLKAYDADNAVVFTNTVNALSGVGTFATMAVTGNKAGTYTLKATATNMVGAETTFSVIPNSANKLVLSATPDTIQANGISTSTITVKVTDAWANKVTDGTYAVTLKKSPATANALAAFADTVLNTINGEASVTVTSTAFQGSDTFTATATGLNGATKTVSTAVMGAAYKVDIAAGDLAKTGTAGTDVSIPVMVKDAAGTTLSYDNGRVVTVTVKDGSTVVGTFTGTTENGVATVKANLTTKKAGYTFEATSEGLSKKTGGTLTINAATATAVKVTADRATMSANTGSFADLTVSLLDQYGNTVTVGANTPVTLKVTSGSNATLVGADASGNLAVQIDIATSEEVVADVLHATSGAGSVVVTATSGTLTSGSVTVNTVVTGEAANLLVDAITDTVASTDVTVRKQVVTVKLVDGLGNVLTHESAASVYIKDVTGETGTVKVYASTDTATELVVGNAATGDVVFDKGVATFYVISDKAEALTYKFASTGLTDKTAVGTFLPGTATTVKVDLSTPAFINGNGIALTTVIGRVTDTNGNTVASASGTMNFTIKTGGDFAVLQQTSAPVVNGMASVVAQSKLIPSGTSSAVQVEASFDVNADGTAETNTLGTTFTVDAVNPTVTVAEAAGVLTATVADASGIASVLFQYTLDAGTTWVDLATDSDVAGGFTTMTAVLAAGTYQFRGIATDMVGRTNTSVATANVVIP